MKRLVFLILIFYHSFLLLKLSPFTTKKLTSIRVSCLISEKPNAFATTNKKGQVDITTLKMLKKLPFNYWFSSRSESYNELIENKSIKLTQNSISINEIVISATRWNQPQKDIPSKLLLFLLKTSNYKTHNSCRFTECIRRSLHSKKSTRRRKPYD